MNQKIQQHILETYFIRGAKVTWWEITFSDQSAWHTGKIECEANDRPGWYYVREDKTQTVFLVQWQDIAITFPEQSL